MVQTSTSSFFKSCLSEDQTATPSFASSSNKAGKHGSISSTISCAVPAISNKDQLHHPAESAMTAKTAVSGRDSRGDASTQGRPTQTASRVAKGPCRDKARRNSCVTKKTGRDHLQRKVQARRSFARPIRGGRRAGSRNMPPPSTAPSTHGGSALR